MRMMPYGNIHVNIAHTACRGVLEPCWPISRRRRLTSSSR